MRLRAKVDRNQAEIVEALRQAGCEVQSLAAVGRGVPDLLVSRRGQLYLLEVKDGRGTLTEDQQRWMAGWRSPVWVVRSVDEALAVLETSA